MEWDQLTVRRHTERSMFLGGGDDPLHGLGDVRFKQAGKRSAPQLALTRMAGGPAKNRSVPREARYGNAIFIPYLPYTFAKMAGGTARLSGDLFWIWPRFRRNPGVRGGGDLLSYVSIPDVPALRLLRVPMMAKSAAKIQILHLKPFAGPSTMKAAPGGEAGSGTLSVSVLRRSEDVYWRTAVWDLPAALLERLGSYARTMEACRCSGSYLAEMNRK